MWVEAARLLAPISSTLWALQLVLLHYTTLIVLMHLFLTQLGAVAFLHIYLSIFALIHLQKTWLHRTLLASEQIDLSFIYLCCSFERAWSYFTTCGWIDIDLFPCVVLYFLYIDIFNENTINDPNIRISTYAVDVSIIETATGCTLYCDGMVCDILPGIGCNILPFARFNVSWAVASSYNLNVFVLKHYSTKTPSFALHILPLHHSIVFQI